MLSQRDEALLRALARFRLARTGDLTDLFFPGVRRDTAAARLRRLFDAGYLSVHFRDRAEENIYTLGPKGRRWFEAQGVSLGRIPRGSPAHHLAIVRAWVALAVAVHGRNRVRIEHVVPDWEIREKIGGRSASIIPDALVQLNVAPPGCEPVHLRFALEVDLGTEPLSILGRKVAAYETLRMSEGLFGWQDFGLVLRLVGAARVRQGNVERLLDARWGSWSVLWTDGEELDRILEDIVRSALPSPYDLPLRQGEAGERM
jgi:hypothetical protein